MPWTLTSYLDWREKEMQNPKVLVFGTIFCAFAAGAALVYQLEEGHRTLLAVALLCFYVAVLLATSFECAYLLLRASRHKQGHSDTEGGS